MKNILLTIIGVLALTSISAQWKGTLNKETGVYEAYIKGTLIDGNNHPSTKIYYWTEIRNSPDPSEFQFKISLGGVNVAYDPSTNDQNYVSVEAIADGDKSSLISLRGTVYNESGYIRVKGENITDLYDLFKTANNVYIKVSSGPSGTINVFKFSAQGFIKSMNEGHSLLEKITDNPFNSSDNPFNSSDDNPFGDKSLSIDSKLEKYLDSYLKIAKNADINIDFVKSKPISIYFEYMRNDELLGIARGAEDDSKINIAINSNSWDRLSELEKTTTMYHELSHDILNASHVENRMHLMHPKNQYRSITDLVVGLTEVFKQYKNKTLKQF